MWLPLAHPLLRTWPATQACALMGNRTSDTLVHRPTLNSLSHTSQSPTEKYFKTYTQGSVCFSIYAFIFTHIDNLHNQFWFIFSVFLFAKINKYMHVCLFILHVIFTFSYAKDSTAYSLLFNNKNQFIEIFLVLFVSDYTILHYVNIVINIFNKNPQINLQ